MAPRIVSQDAPQTFSETRFAGYFLAIQGAAIFLWWGALWARPDLRLLFAPPGEGEALLLSFWLPDLLLGAASLLAAALFFAGSPAALLAAWGVAGAMGYAALFCVTAALGGRLEWWCVVFMVPAAFFSAVAAADLGTERFPAFRRARPASRGWNLVKTGLQTAAFWAVFLALLPWTIRFVELRLGLPLFSFPGQLPAAATLFALFSALGLASGYTMGRLGEGTPLPLDSTRRMVIAGPYKVLRNPMVVAGLGQGLAVGIGMGSCFVVLYVLVGGLAWHFLARPAEEADLARAFGAEYEVYRRRVPCWIPRFPRAAAAQKAGGSRG